MLKTSEEERAWLKKDIKFQSRPVYPELLDDIDTLLEENKRLREVAVKLWDILDDIDTLGDAMKPEITPYFNAVNTFCGQRHQLMTSDGHNLELAREALGRKVGG